MKAVTGRRPSAKSKGPDRSVSNVLVAGSDAASPAQRMPILRGIYVLICLGSSPGADVIPAAMNMSNP